MTRIKKMLMILFITAVLIGGSGFAAKPAQASGCAYYHVVRQGQTLSGIARWYGAYWPYLAQINGIQSPRYRIYTGQVLCINFGGYGGRYTTYPTYTPTTTSGTGWDFAVSSVTQNTSVTIRTHNFPSNVLFKAKMGRSSGGGYVWVDLPDVDSGAGGSFDVTFNIPSQLQGASQLVVRLSQNKKNGKTFTQDGWFSNVSGGSGTGGRGVIYDPYNYYRGTIPTIWIVSVVRNSSVTIRTANFPANTNFQVLMGPIGARGFGYHVTTFNSGAGGAMTLTFPIPPQLYGSHQISIRTQNNWTGHFSYNWFFNNTAY